MTLFLNQHIINESLMDKMNMYEYRVIHCCNIRGDFELKPWPSVVHVFIKNCPQLRVLPLWPSLNTIQIINCPNIITLPNWYEVSSVELRSCSGLTQIPSWPTVYNMTIADCPNIQEFQLLNTIKILTMIDLNNLNKFTGDGYVADLTIINCVILTNLPHSHQITIYDCCPGICYPSYTVMLQTDFMIHDLEQELYVWLK